MAEMISTNSDGTGTSQQQPNSPVGVIVVVFLFVLLAMSTGFAGVIVVLSLVAMLFLHELGHYLAARRAGMKVTEFFIGFGPKIWSFRRLSLIHI